MCTLSHDYIMYSILADTCNVLVDLFTHRGDPDFDEPSTVFYNTFDPSDLQRTL